MDYEKVLEEFINEERRKTRAGSGDDLYYEQQIEDYINDQRMFWIQFMKFIEKKLHPKILTKTKVDFYMALKAMLGIYNSYKIDLKNSKKEAVANTLKAYDDFYDWLQEEKNDPN
jgi:hypothetical protein